MNASDNSRDVSIRGNGMTAAANVFSKSLNLTNLNRSVSRIDKRSKMMEKKMPSLERSENVTVFLSTDVFEHETMTAQD